MIGKYCFVIRDVRRCKKCERRVPISSSARKHFVNAEYVPWVHSYTHVEGLFGSHLGNVLVAANTGSLECLAGDLFSLQGNEVDTEGELIRLSLLTTKIKDADLGVWHTTAITGLGIGLVLAIPIASSGS